MPVSMHGKQVLPRAGPTTRGNFCLYSGESGQSVCGTSYSSNISSSSQCVHRLGVDIHECSHQALSAGHIRAADVTYAASHTWMLGTSMFRSRDVGPRLFALSVLTAITNVSVLDLLLTGGRASLYRLTSCIACRLTSGQPVEHLCC